MAVEIERKYLLRNNTWRNNAVGTQFRQGYLSTEPQRTVRVRLEGEIGKLTIKGQTEGISRSEYEYEIPQHEALELLDSLCLKPLIEKTRYRLEYAGQLWEVDEFHGDNEGLLVAEIELTAEDQKVTLPDWVGTEVSDQRRYYNASLVKHPFKDW